VRVAAQVAAEKQEHPERFCPVKKCLWRTGDGSRCPRHVEYAAMPVDEYRPVERARAVLREAGVLP